MRIMAKDLFTKCRRVEKRIDAKIEERARIRALGERVTASYSSEPRGGSGPTSKVEIAAVRLVDLEGELTDAITRMVEYRRFVQKVADRLSDDRFRDLLTWRYINCWEWDKIAVAMGVDVKWTYKLHDRALEEAQAILDGMEIPHT